MYRQDHGAYFVNPLTVSADSELQSVISQSTTADLPADETTTATIEFDGGIFNGVTDSIEDIDWVEITGLFGGENVTLTEHIPATQDPTFYIAPDVSMIAIDASGVQHDLGRVRPDSFYIEDFGAETTYYLQIGDGDTLDAGDYAFSLSTSSDDFLDNIHTTGVIVVNGITSGVHETEGDTDWFRLDIEANTTYAISFEGRVRASFHDANGDPFDNVSSIFDPSTNTRTYVISQATDETIFVRSSFAFGNGYPTPDTYSISVEATPVAPDDHSDNFTPEDATSLLIGESLEGVISSIADDDIFYTTFDNAIEYTFEIEANVSLTIFDSSASTVFNSGVFSFDTDPVSGNSIVSFIPNEPGNYYIRLQNTDSGAGFPIDYTLISSSEVTELASLDDSASTSENPDAYEIGEVLNGQGNFGFSPDFDYYEFTVADGQVVFFDTVNVRDEGFLSFSITDSTGEVLDPNFSPFIVDPFNELEFSASIYRFAEGGTYTLATRSGSSQSGSDPFGFSLISTTIPDYAVPAAIQDLFGEDIALWFPTFDIGDLPTVPSIGTTVRLERLTNVDGSFEENLSQTVGEGETLYADDDGIIVSSVSEGVIVNNGTMWSNFGTTAIGGTDLASFDNNGLFVALGDISATGLNFVSTLNFHNDGDFFVFATEGFAQGIQASSPNTFFGDGLNYNTGNLIVQSLAGQARAVTIRNESNFDNSGAIIVDGFTNAIAVIIGGEFTNSGDIVSTVGSLSRNSVGVTYSNDSSLRTITNSGTITADISLLLNQFSDTDNSGILNGDVIYISDGVEPNDIGLTTDLINSGVINGDVLLDDDVSIYDGTGGFVSGLISLGAADDIAIGGEFSDFIEGGLGDDVLDGGAGIDVAFYETGIFSDFSITHHEDGSATVSHTLYGEDDLTNFEFIQISDTVFALSDSTSLTNGSDVYSGTDIGETILGLDGNDVISAAGGDDILEGGAGADVLDGGEGVDTASYAGSTNRVVINAATNSITSGHASGDTFVSIENIIGSNFNDVITGSGDDNVISGGNGFDVLSGFNGDDTLNGGAGRDLLTGGAGADVIDGGDGASDMVRYVGSNAGVTVDLGAGIASGGHADGDVLSNVEQLLGSSHADILTGTDENNFVFGDGGDDVLDGSAGIDKLFGGAGADTFVFGAGDEFVFVTDWQDDVDSLDLSQYDFASLEDALANFDQRGAHVRFFVDGETLLILNTDLEDIADDIIIDDVMV